MSDENGCISGDIEFGSQAKVNINSTANSKHVESFHRESEVVAGIPGQPLDVPGTVAGVPGQSQPISHMITNTSLPTTDNTTYLPNSENNLPPLIACNPPGGASSCEKTPSYHAPNSEIKKRTLKIFLKKGVFYSEIDILKQLKNHIQLSKVESIYTVGRNHEWFVTLFEKQEVDKITGRTIKIKGHDAVLESMDRDQAVIRVHWLPYWIPTDPVLKALSQYGKIIKHEHESIFSDDEDCKHIKSSIRRIVMECTTENKNKIPYLLHLEGQAVLLSMKGRPPMCLKCHEYGHIRSQCTTPFCRKCKEFGHITEGCDKKPSYAKAVTQTLPETESDLETETMDTETPNKDPISENNFSIDPDDFGLSLSNEKTVYNETSQPTEQQNTIHGITDNSQTDREMQSEISSVDESEQPREINTRSKRTQDSQGFTQPKGKKRGKIRKKLSDKQIHTSNQFDELEKYLTQ